MKRLLYIQDHLGLGGISTVESIKENWLVEHGYDVANIFTHYEEVDSIKKRYDGKIKMKGIPLAKRNEISKIPFAGRLLWYVYFRCIFILYLYRINPDVIISTHPNLEPVTVIFFTFWKKRFLEHHISGKLQGGGLRTWIIRYIKMPFYRQVCLTEGDAIEKEVYYKRKAIVMPNPCKKIDIKPSTCHNKRVIIPSRLNAQKGIKQFLPFWKQLETVHSDWELHLYGEGEEKDDIIKIIDENEYKTVFVHPFASNVIEKMADCSLLLLPSMYEGFPTTLVEAMSCGVPCVAFDCKFGPADIIKDGEDGFLVELMNYEQFVERIDKLINDEELRCLMGLNARKNIQRYNLDYVMSKWENLFRK